MNESSTSVGHVNRRVYWDTIGSVPPIGAIRTSSLYFCLPRVGICSKISSSRRLYTLRARRLLLNGWWCQFQLLLSSRERYMSNSYIGRFSFLAGSIILATSGRRSHHALHPCDDHRTSLSLLYLLQPRASIRDEISRALA